MIDDANNPIESAGPSREDELLKSLEEYDRKQAELEQDDAPVVVKISEDRLKASVRVKAPLDVGRDLTAQDVNAALQESGVTSGIDSKAIQEIFVYGSFGFFVPVAFGQEPTNCNDAYIDYKFNTDRGVVRLEQDKQGNVNPYELNMIESVDTQAVIAVKVPATKGEPGADVCGQEIPARLGRDVEMIAGDNTELSQDGLSVIATISGQPILRDEKLIISPVLEIPGDVDFGVGNVDFDGTVLIYGNVLAEFTVKATQDIQIKGNLEKSTVQAGGSVIVGGGLYGLNEGRITAGDSVVIRSVDSGIVEADRNITITQAARHSQLYAGENLTLTNPKGSIMGGRIICGKTCDVTELGSPSFTETIVEIGLGPRTSKIYKDLEKDLSEYLDKRQKLGLNIKTMKEKKEKGVLAPDKEELLKKSMPAYQQLNAMIDEVSSRLKFFRNKIDSLKGGSCRVRDLCHPNVKIITPNSTYSVREESKHCSFTELNENIVFGPY